MTRPPVRGWTDFDEGLLHTLWVVSFVLRGEQDRLHQIHPHFAIDWAGGERLYTAGRFDLLEYAAPGDGTYAHDSSMFFATGRGGLTMTAALAAGRAVGNSRRRRQAASDAVPRWMKVDQGTLYVGNQGFWIETMRGLFPWPWGLVQSATMLNQGVVQVQGQAAIGPVNWQLISPAAEALFALWVIGRRVPHPQWMGRTWIPPQWIPWAHHQGKQSPFADASEVDTRLNALPHTRSPRE